MKRVIVVAALLTAVLIGEGLAVIPQTINFQGVLTDAGGMVVPDGTYSVTFRLYDVASGGSHLWEETHTAVTVTKGIFNVMLGSVASFGLDFDTQYFLGMSVEGEAELEPRVCLTSNAYSLGARGVYGVSNVIPADGFVGIGTTIPGYPLTVESDRPVGIYFNGNSDTWTGIYANARRATAKPQFGYTRQGQLKASTYVDTNDYFRLYMNGADRLTVKPDGDVGIGVTEPIEKLDVSGGIRIGATSNENTGTIRFSGGDFEGYDGSSWQSLTGSGGSGLPVGSAGQTLRHSGSDWVATGNLYNDGSAVGIGTSSPAAPLDILGGNWDLVATDGDLKIGDPTYKLKIGVSTGGLDAGSARIRMEGGDNKLVLGAGTADVLSIKANGDVRIGSDAQSGKLYLHNSGIAEPIIYATSTVHGGLISTYDEDHNLFAGLYPDTSGDTGGWFFVRRNGTETGFMVDGNYSASGEPSVGVYGSTRSAILNMAGSGNTSVTLPQDAISSYEILDEPGGASYTEGNSLLELSSEYQSIIASQSIHAPSNGYCLVIASCEVVANHVNGIHSLAQLGISETSDDLPNNQDVDLQLPSTAGTGLYQFPVTCTAFFSATEGMHTYYFLGAEAGGDNRVTEIQFTIIFIPSAFGVVEPTMASAEGGLDGDERVVITEADVTAQRAASEAANVARIERELAEIRAEVEAMKRESERQLREAEEN